MFEKKGNTEMQKRLPQFVKRLEEELYRTAPSKVCPKGSLTLSQNSPVILSTYPESLAFLTG